MGGRGGGWVDFFGGLFFAGFFVFFNLRKECLKLEALGM